MTHTCRTFIAVDLDHHIKRAIEDIQQYLKKQDCSIKWVRPESLHLTLKFLGNVKSRNIEKLKAVLSDVFQNISPIPTELTELNAFPNIGHPQILWIGLQDNQQSITSAARSLEKSLGAIGYKKEQKPFSPHITIGRIRSPKNLKLLSETMLECPIPAEQRMTINCILLYKSILTSQGPIYDILERFPLR